MTGLRCGGKKITCIFTRANADSVMIVEMCFRGAQGAVGRVVNMLLYVSGENGLPQGVVLESLPAGCQKAVIILTGVFVTCVLMSHCTWLCFNHNS